MSEYSLQREHIYAYIILLVYNKKTSIPASDNVLCLSLEANNPLNPNTKGEHFRDTDIARAVIF